MKKEFLPKKIKNVFLFTLLLSSLFGNAQITQKTVPKVKYTKGPTRGSLIPLDTSNSPTSLLCIVNGITITTSGSVNGAPYLAPNAINSNCTPNAAYILSNGNWTGFDSAGTVVYTFSAPVYSARVSYSSIDDDDVAQLSINAPGMVLSNPCRLNIVGTDQIHSVPSTSWGNVGITVSSATPFTSITLTNIGGSTGWVTGNPCRFILSTVSPIPVNCPKIYLNNFCYNATAPQTTTYGIFDNNHPMNSQCGIPCMVNGVPCSSSNVTIEPVTPLPFGCTYNPNGTVTIPAGVYPFNTGNQYFYKLRSVANPAFVSEPYRVDFGIAPRITTNLWQEITQEYSSIYNEVLFNDRYVSGNYNVLTNLMINPNTNGVCNYIPAVVGPATLSNTVTILDTTPDIGTWNINGLSGKQYFKINPDGTVAYTPTYNQYGTNYPLPLPFRLRLTYRATINNTGNGAPFYYDGEVFISCIPGDQRIAFTNQPKSIKIYPNPSSNGYFNLLFDQLLTDAILEVYDAMGILVTTKELKNANEYLLDLETAPKGMYRVKVLTKEETLTTTIVKQ